MKCLITFSRKIRSESLWLTKRSTGKVWKAGLGTFVLRNRESLVLIKPYNDILILNKLRYPEEIRDTSEIKVTSSHSKPGELKMAVQLIEQLSGEFDISKYKDTYTDQLLKLIQAKAKGKKLQPSPLRVVHSKSKDLMSQLKESLQTKKKSILSKLPGH